MFHYIYLIITFLIEFLNHFDVEYLLIFAVGKKKNPTPKATNQSNQKPQNKPKTKPHVLPKPNQTNQQKTQKQQPQTKQSKQLLRKPWMATPFLREAFLVRVVLHSRTIGRSSSLWTASADLNSAAKSATMSLGDA